MAALRVGQGLFLVESGAAFFLRNEVEQGELVGPEC